MLSRMAPSSPPEKRTLHLLKTPDILCANDNRLSVSYSFANSGLSPSQRSLACPFALRNSPHPFAGNYPRLSHNGFVSTFLRKEPVHARPLLYIFLIAVFERARLQPCRKGEILTMGFSPRGKLCFCLLLT